MAVILSLVGSLLGGLAPIVNAAGVTTCSGGVIAPGTYVSLTITGTCLIETGTVDVRGGLTIAPDATLIAVSAAATVTISGDVQVESGAVLVFGCAPSISELCGLNTSYVVNGNVQADGSLALILHGNTIRGDVALLGGGGGVSCEGAILGGEYPAFSAIEGNRIAGGLVVSGLESCWFGMARNHVSGTVTLQGNTLADPDSMEVIANTIDGSLACWGNSPLPHNDGQTNAVTGVEAGQCSGL